MLDPLLRRFVEASDEAEAERELNALIEQHALPRREPQGARHYFFVNVSSQMSGFCFACRVPNQTPVTFN